MKRIISLLVVMAMMLASVLAIIPVSATGSISSSDSVVMNNGAAEEIETTRFLTAEAYNAFKAEFEGGAWANANAFANQWTPFAFLQAAANAKFYNQRILKVFLPVKSVGTPNQDDNGKVKFTISIFDVDDIKTISDPVAVHEILVDPASVEAGKIAEIDLSAYNIVIPDGYTMAFGSQDDTLLPSWTGSGNLKQIIVDNASYATGIYGCVGRSNVVEQSENCIYLDFEMTPMTEDDLPYTYMVNNFLSNEAYEAIKAHYEGSDIGASAYVPSVAPFVIAKDAGRVKFGGKRILSISLPVEQTKDLDANGDLTFTITVFKISALNSTEAPVATHTLKFNAAQYGLEGNKTSVHKFVKFDLANANIVVGEGEVIGLCKDGDTLIPAYNGNGIGDILNAKAPYAAGFGAYAGTTKYNSNTWPTSYIYFDVEMVDAEAGLPIYDEADLKNMVPGAKYFLANDITVAGAINANNITLDGNGKTITLSGANGLFGDVSGSTLKNFTLAGGTTTTGVAKTTGNTTLKNITVNITKIEGSGSVGAFITESNGNITIYDCTNNAEVTGGEVAGAIGKQVAGSGNTISITKFYNNGKLTGSNTAGAITGWHAGAATLTVDDSVNLGNLSAKYTGGFIGANFAGGGTTLTNCVNGASDKNVTITASTQGAGGIVGHSNNVLTLNNCKNYAKVTSAEMGAGGLVGRSVANLTVNNCANYGAVTLTNGEYKWGAAGVVGDFSSGTSTVTVNGFENTAKIDTFCAAGSVVGWAHAGALNVKNAKNSGVITAKYAGGFVGAKHGDGNGYFENCENTANIESKGTHAGGFFGEYGQTVELVGCTNRGKVSGGGTIGGFAGQVTANFTITNSANYGEISGGGTNYGGGIVGLFAGAKFVARNTVVKYTHNVGGQWNYCGGGFVGTFKANNVEFYFTDCVVDLILNDKGGNAGGYIGGSTDGANGNAGYTAKKVAFLRCVSLGENKGNGNRTGYLGQAKFTDGVFIDCINAMDCESKNDNIAAGYIPYCGGFSTATFVNCINTGDMKAPNVQTANGKTTGKSAAGFASSAGGGYVYMYGCANYGNIVGCSADTTIKGSAAGLVAAINSEIVNSFNVGSTTGYNTSDFTTDSTSTVTNCFGAGNNADIINAFKNTDAFCPGTMAKQDRLNDLKAAVEAKDVAAITAILKDINTYIEADGSVDFNDPSLKINVKVAEAMEGDYVALVKKGATDAIITVLVKDITENFDLFAVAHNGLEAGTYDLKLCRADGTVLHAKEIEIAVNLIMTAEQFMAMEEKSGDYVLGADIEVAGGLEFHGNFNGGGHTIVLTGDNGLFKYLNSENLQTIKNFRVEAISTKVSYAVARSLYGDVTIENVHVGLMKIETGDRVGSFIMSVDNKPFNEEEHKGQKIVVDNSQTDIIIRNCSTAANLYGTWVAGGIIGRAADIKSLILENVVNNGTIVRSNINHSTTNYGSGGLVGYVHVTEKLTVKNCVNYANVTTAQIAKMGGIINIIDKAKNVEFENVVNYGNVSGNNNCATGGLIGLTTDSNTEYTLKNCTNYGSVSAGDTNSKGVGGIFGEAKGKNFKLENVKNLASVTGGTFVGGIAGNISATNAELDYVSNGGENTNITVTGHNQTDSWQTHGTAGIFGHAMGKFDLDHVDNYAKVTTSGTRATNVAGFIGMFANGDALASEFVASNCANYGEIQGLTGGTGTSGFIAHIKWVAGIDVSFYDCVNYGDLTGTGGGHKGGFIGYAEANPGDAVYTLEDCKNYGDVTGNGIVAGLVARTQNATVNITDCENNGDVYSGTNIAAGIFCYDNTSTIVNITNTVNNGRVSTVNAEKPAAGIALTGKITLNGCTNNGLILANGKAAGLIAWAGAEDTIINCVNNGMVLSASGNAYAGSDNANTVGADTVVNNAIIGDFSTTVEIWTAEDFMNMTTNMNYKLMDNIILPEDYQPISVGSDVFTAKIDGNGKTIYMKGLNTALFSELFNAEISNLTIVGNINANAVIADTAIGNVTIDNVVVDVDINANGDAAGFIAKSTVGLTITDSKFLGNITATGKAAGIAVEAAGNITLDDVTVGDVGLTTAITGTGLVGGIFALIENATANITGTVNFAAVKQTASDGSIGGLIGKTQLTTITLNECENYGKVDNARSSGSINGTGGLIGEVDKSSNATILNSTNYADVTTAYSVPGGLVGTLTDKSNITFGSIDDNGNVDNGSVNFGNVRNTWTSWTFAAGGILGAANGESGASIKFYDTVNYGDVTSNNGNTGGMLGLTNSGNAAIIEVIGCANYGAISSNGNNRVGGMLGQTLATTIRVKDTTNFGYISSQTGLANNNDADGGTCHAAGIRPEYWTGTTTIEYINCVNFGTIYSKTSSAAGIGTRVDATNSKIEGCVNYGTIIGGYTTSGICSQPKDGQVKNCANYGLIVNNTNGAQVAPGADATNVAAGAIVSSTDLAKIAKNINATDYIMKNLDDLIGTSTSAEVDVDLTALAYLAYDENGVVGDLDRYFDLDLTATSIVANATNEGDYADLTAVLARTYAAKLARVSTETTFELTFDAKVTGTKAGFVYAIAPNATAHTLTNVFAAFDAEDYVLTDDGYAQFKVEYNGLFATISVLVDLGEGEDWYKIETVLLEDGAYAAIGVVNGASANVYDDEGALVTSYVDNAQIATVANVNFEISCMVGGIVNAFKALDRLAADLADAQFAAADHADALNKATTAKEAAKQVLDDAEALVDQRTTEYADAVASITVNMTPDEINALLNPYREALNAAMKAEAEATRAYNLTVAAYDNAAANEALAADDYADLAASYEDDVKDAYADIATAIDEAINYADLIDAILAIYKLGDKFRAKYSDEVINTVNAAVNAATNATTQEELDAQVEIINSYLTALDWAEFNYYVEVVNSLVEEDYTIFSWADFVEACEAIDGPDSYETQADVDAAVDAIIAALALLKDDIYQAAELQEYLDAAIAEREYWNAEETNENYTANSWLDFYNATIKPFQDAIDALEDLTDGSQFNTLEADLIAKYEAFKTAYDKTDRENGLIVMVEINALRDKALDAISEDPSVAYSDITKLYLLAALPEAERAYALIAEADAVRDYEAAQAAVDAAIAAYAPVTNGLVGVDAIIEAIATYTAEVEGKVYTVETWNDFELALATAEFAVVTAKSDEEAAEALAALTAAFDALVEYVEVNLDTLNNAIATAEALNKADYTKDSWDELREAILNAKLAAYSDDQATIDAAYAALVDAMDNGLVKMPTTDALEALIAEVAALNSVDYTAETWLNAALALQAAKAALKAEAQTEVDEAKAALTAAKAALVKKAAADNSALKALITEIEALNSADYTEETWADLQAALTAAKAALTSDKQADLDIAKATLAAAKAGLDKVVVEEEKTEVKTEETAPVETEKKGCKSAIGATVVVMTAVLGLGATVVLKKKED